MEGFDSATKTIMVVDDNVDFVDVVRRMLEKEGYAVDCAYGGSEAFERLESKKPDLIVLDVTMPDMNGLHVLARLKAASDTSSIPVILVTANDDDLDVLRGYQMGGDYFIAKPFNSDQLMSGIGLLLGSGGA